MQRILTDRLVTWKDDPDRKPLLIQGVRHSGKTYLLREFGAKYYGKVFYIDFKRDSHISYLFNQTRDIHRLLKDLSILLEKDIKPENTLIILDNIHLCPDALETLKYFADTAPEYHVAAASSYLGIALPKGVSVPVDKLEVFTLFPMNFYEFLLAQSPMLAFHLKESGFREEPYITFHKQLEEKFCDYQIVGGMPEVVECWINTKSIESVEKLQTRLIRSIESDFAAYSPARMLPKLISVWNAVPVQLTKGNRKFMFTQVKKYWRGKDLDDVVHRLMRAGLIYKVEHIEKPGIPVAAFLNPAHFKLYMCDTGLLRRIGGFSPSMVLSRGSNYANIRDAVAENIVCAELMRIYEQDLYYWSAENPGKAEVDFIVQDDAELIPIEVKSGSASRARSLQQYKMRFNPKKFVLTGTDTDKDDVLPLYGFWNLKEWLNGKR